MCIDTFERNCTYVVSWAMWRGINVAEGTYDIARRLINVARGRHKVARRFISYYRREKCGIYNNVAVRKDDSVSEFVCVLW